MMDVVGLGLGWGRVVIVVGLLASGKLEVVSAGRSSWIVVVVVVVVVGADGGGRWAVEGGSGF